MEPKEQADAGEITDTNQTRSVGRGCNRILWLAVSTLVITGVTWGVTQLLSNVNTHDVETLTDFDAIDSKDKLGGGQYLIPSPIEDVGAPPLRADTCNGRYQWAHSKSGIDVSSTLSRVTITAEKDHQVQIIGARRVPVGEQKSPAVGSVLTCPGAGAPPVRHAYINLDTGDMAYFDGESDQPQQELNIPVESGKTEVLDIQAQTEQYDWAYKIELVLRVDGEEVVETINDGKPFRTTAPTNAKQYRWIDDGWPWRDARFRTTAADTGYPCHAAERLYASNPAGIERGDRSTTDAASEFSKCPQHDSGR